MGRSFKQNLLGRMPWSLWGIALNLHTDGRGSLRRFRKANVGANTYIDPTVQIFGYQNVRIGSNTTISEEVLLNASSRDDHADEILIGNNCHIGRRNYFSTGGSIEVGDYGFTGLDCHFLGCGHKTDDPRIPYIASGLTNGSPILVETNCWLTTSVTVHEGVTIGRGSVIGAGTIVRHDVPPFSIVSGQPAKVVRRYDFKNNAWVAQDQWSDELEKFVPSAAEYLSTLRMSHAAIDLSLHSASRRFGWLP